MLFSQRNTNISHLQLHQLLPSPHRLLLLPAGCSTSAAWVAAAQWACFLADLAARHLPPASGLQRQPHAEAWEGVPQSTAAKRSKHSSRLDEHLPCVVPTIGISEISSSLGSCRTLYLRDDAACEALLAGKHERKPLVT
jgi:hypothetical protein